MIFNKILFKTNNAGQIYSKMLNSQKLNNQVLESQEIGTLADFRAFEERLSLVIKNYLYKNQTINILSFKEKQMIFDRLCYICPLQSAFECVISVFQLNKINKEYHKIINEFRFKLEGKKISLTDFNILASFYDVIYHGIKNRKRRRYLKEKYAVAILEGVSLLKQVPKLYTACFSILVDCLNEKNSENYSFEMLAKQKGLGMILTPVFNIKAESVFTQEKELELLLNLKEKEKQKSHDKIDVQDIYNLKNYNLNINAMQEANYEKFLSYIKQGKNTKLTIDNSNREELTLQSHSIWKLLQLLIINTVGLVVVSLTKIVYSLIFKLKNLFQKGKNGSLKSCNQESEEYPNTKRLVPNKLNVTNEQSSPIKKQAI